MHFGSNLFEFEYLFVLVGQIFIDIMKKLKKKKKKIEIQNLNKILKKKFKK